MGIQECLPEELVTIDHFPFLPLLEALTCRISTQNMRNGGILTDFGKLYNILGAN